MNKPRDARHILLTPNPYGPVIRIHLLIDLEHFMSLKSLWIRVPAKCHKCKWLRNLHVLEMFFSFFLYRQENQLESFVLYLFLIICITIGVKIYLFSSCGVFFLVWKTPWGLMWVISHCVPNKESIKLIGIVTGEGLYASVKKECREWRRKERKSVNKLAAVWNSRGCILLLGMIELGIYL